MRVFRPRGGVPDRAAFPFVRSGVFRSRCVGMRWRVVDEPQVASIAARGIRAVRPGSNPVHVCRWLARHGCDDRARHGASRDWWFVVAESQVWRGDSGCRKGCARPRGHWTRVRWPRGRLDRRGVVGEMPRHFVPVCSPGQPRALTIFADSLTAGMEENEAVTWPRCWRGGPAIEVHDWSRMGGNG